jgi:small-conductance mechanosensitive channel
MLLDTFISQLHSRLMGSFIAFFIISLFALFVYLVFRHAMKSEKQKLKLRSRIVYLSSLVLILLLVHIWVEDISHFFTMLSLVAAGLLIVNKENIMNLTGYLIINWRGVFAEGDYIQIQQYTGYVESIRVLYIKLYETSGIDSGQSTGKVIKIPNALIITQPVVLVPIENKHLLFHRTTYVSTLDADNLGILETAKETIGQLLQDTYKDDPTYSRKMLAIKNRVLANLIQLKPSVELKMVPDKEKIVLIHINFYCYLKDIKTIEQSLLASLIKRYGHYYAR